ncbi:MAG TPA: glucose 1-dehydrogenase [Candidatus Sulfotelmatobacter sp.]|nr:glucose 1-dehydrogenase [Candidatus Sulfotelmatobacter sp.]
MGRLTGKVAIVTGASKGIGAGIAKGLAAEGASVVVNYASSKEGAERVVAEITKGGGKATAVKADTSKQADVQRLFAEAKKAYGRVDVVVNNAGVYKFEPVESIQEEEFHRQYNTNVLGPLLATQEAIKYFGPEGGSIINIGSVAGSNPTPTSAVYSGTKAALDQITRVLSLELGPKKIRVNSLNPGFTLTEGVTTAGFAGSEQEKYFVSRTVLGRPGTPEDIAKVAVFLASDDSRWVTGETIAVSGGYR